MQMQKRLPILAISSISDAISLPNLRNSLGHLP
jgi:hypothetical protein